MTNTHAEALKEYWNTHQSYHRFHRDYADADIARMLTSGDHTEKARLQVAFDDQLNPVFKDIPRTDGMLLEVGCGGGWNLVSLSDRFEHLTGVDLAENWINTARTYTDNFSNIHIAECNGYDLKQFPNDAFDVVLFTYTLHHLGNPVFARDYLAELARVTKPSGQLWLTTPVTDTENPQYYTSRPKLDTLARHYKENKIRIVGRGLLGRCTGALLDEVFEGDHFRNSHCFINSDQARLHPGMCFVVAGSPREAIVKTLLTQGVSEKTDLVLDQLIAEVTGTWIQQAFEKGMLCVLAEGLEARNLEGVLEPVFRVEHQIDWQITLAELAENPERRALVSPPMVEAAEQATAANRINQKQWLISNLYYPGLNALAMKNIFQTSHGLAKPRSKLIWPTAWLLAWLETTPWRLVRYAKQNHPEGSQYISAVLELGS